MKKIIVFAACLLSLHVVAQDIKTDSIKSKSSYCAEMKDGIMVLSSEGKQLSNDVVLSTGTTVSVNGMVKTKDGIARQMNEGECIDLANSTAAVTPPNKKDEPLR